MITQTPNQSQYQWTCANGPPTKKPNQKDSCCKKPSDFDGFIIKSCAKLTKKSNGNGQNNRNNKNNGNGQNNRNGGNGNGNSQVTGNCFFECVLNETNILVSGGINPQTAVSAISQYVTKHNASAATYWLPVITAGINFCYQSAYNNYALIMNGTNSSYFDGINYCSPYSGYFLKCLFSFEYRECPNIAGSFSQSTRCSDLLSYFRACPTPPLNY